MELKPVIEDSFIQYSGAVLQSRALVDVRDCLKPSARQIFYCLETDGLVHSKPMKKTLKSVSSAMRVYIHGDTSCNGILMRSGQPFCMRYPLLDVGGSFGTIMSAGNWAAPRYTSARLAEITELLFADIKKETIDDWRDNYDDTEKYPSVSTGKGFYNIVNGSTGIGIGMACSIPAFNLKEVNEALIKLLWDKNISFDEIYCAPDFATGGVLLNGPEVKESLRVGNGNSCKLRAVIEYNEKERTFIVKEMPYGVYTNTVCSELEKILNEGDEKENPGIERFNDLTGTTPNLKIYLKKNANVDKVLKFLYKSTSLQHYYGVNLTMLDNGHFPKLFGWQEALQAHLDHERIIYTKGFQFDLRKITERLHIITGLQIAMANIEEVISTIKKSPSAAVANKKLCENFKLDIIQAKAILDMKLSRLASLEVGKLVTEREGLEKEEVRISRILSDEVLLNKEIETGLRDVAKKYGDARRTTILSLSSLDDDTVLEKKQLSLSFTSQGAVFVTETSTLLTQKRNGVGAKFNLENGEYIVDNIVGQNTDTILFFTSHGNFYHMKMGDFAVGEKQYLNSLVTILPYETFKAASIFSEKTEDQSILFLTKKGLIKKSLSSSYNLKRKGGMKAISLDEDDEIISVVSSTNGRLGILTEKGNLLLIETEGIRAIGRISRGISCIKLNEGDTVVSARIIPANTTEILSISNDGYSKRSPIDEFKITGRGTKGVKVQKSATLCDFLPIESKEDILVNASTTQIRVKIEEITSLSRGAQGTKTIKLTENSKVIKLSKI